MTWWLETEIFLWVVVSKGFTFTNLHTCPIPMKWSFLIPVVKRHSQCNRRFTHLQIFSYSLRSFLFMIPCSGQYIYIYRFTHMSNTYEIKFLNPCSEEGIHRPFTMQLQGYILSFTQGNVNVYETMNEFTILTGNLQMWYVN